MTNELTTTQRAITTQALRNAKDTIEALQEAPLDIGQACTIYDLCVALNIQPVTILGEALTLIDDSDIGAPALLDLLKEMPEFLSEIGKAVNL